MERGGPSFPLLAPCPRRGGNRGGDPSAGQLLLPATNPLPCDTRGVLQHSPAPTLRTRSPKDALGRPQRQLPGLGGSARGRGGPGRSCGPIKAAIPGAAAPGGGCGRRRRRFAGSGARCWPRGAACPGSACPTAVSREGEKEGGKGVFRAGEGGNVFFWGREGGGRSHLAARAPRMWGAGKRFGETEARGEGGLPCCRHPWVPSGCFARLVLIQTFPEVLPLPH